MGQISEHDEERMRGAETSRRVRRTDIDGRLEELDPPPEILLKAKLIALKTRLSRRERADVAVEVCADAMANLHAGHDLDRTVALMGDPKAEARRIRVQRFSQKPILWRFFRGWVRRFACFVGISLLVYAIAAVRFHMVKPQMRRNFAAEHNAAVAQVPVSERAATVYKRAIVESELDVDTEMLRCWPRGYPGDEGWERVVSWVDRHDVSTRSLHEGAALKTLGVEVADGTDREWMKSEPATIEPATENPPVISWSSQHLAAMRRFARQLMADVYVAAAGGRADRVREDLVAMIRIARQLLQTETMLSDLVSIAVLGVAEECVGDLILKYPGLMDEAALASIEGELKGYAGGKPMVFQAGHEDRMILDYLQRSYSDDGNGDGRLCADGVRNLSKAAGNGWRLSSAAWINGPINAYRLPTRKQIWEQWCVLRECADKDASQRPFQRMSMTVQTAIDRMNTSPGRNRVLLVLSPGLTSCIHGFDRALMDLDGTMVAIAVERFRLMHGRWPAKVGELVPDLLRVVPPDGHDGASMKYRLSETGPVVYSVGGDRDDDGGRAASGSKGNDRTARWVPPGRVATAADGDYVIWPRPVESHAGSPDGP
jgi:hypothetical protein